MKLCKDCPTPEKCKAAGKCLKMPKKGMSMGGMAKKKMGYSEGGMACGASNPPARPMKKGK
jgi:hypothetical protein